MYIVTISIYLLVCVLEHDAAFSWHSCQWVNARHIVKHFAGLLRLNGGIYAQHSPFRFKPQNSLAVVSVKIDPVTMLGKLRKNICQKAFLLLLAVIKC